MKRLIFLIILLFAFLGAILFFPKENRTVLTSTPIAHEFSLTILNDKNNIDLVIEDHGSYHLLHLKRNNTDFSYINKYMKYLNISQFDTVLSFFDIEPFPFGITYHHLKGLQKYTIQNLSFSLLSNKLIVSYPPYEFCFFDASFSSTNEVFSTDFLYIYNLHDKFFADLRDDIKVLFYGENEKMSDMFQEEILSTWLDTWIVNSNPVMTVISENGYEVNELLGL